MIRIRTVAASALALAALGGVSACSSSGGGASATPPPSTVSSGSGTASATGSTTDGASGAVAQSAGGPSSASAGSGSGTGSSGTGSSRTGQCAESQLRANAVAADIRGLNRHVVKLTFTNTSSSTCTLTGYPGAAIEDDSNKQVQQAKRVVGGPVGGTIEQNAGPVTLRAGATAYAWLEGASTREQGAAQAGCDGAKYPRILVTPPNTRTAVPFSIGWPQCYAFDVHPVRQD